MLQEVFAGRDFFFTPHSRILLMVKLVFSNLSFYLCCRNEK